MDRAALDTSLDREWLEADGLGGFASGTAGLLRTRRYHSLLLCAANPPADRFVLVNGVEVFVDTPAGRHALSSQYYAPDVIHPRGCDVIESFRHEPWPTFEFLLEDGTRIRHEILVARELPGTLLRWQRVSASGTLLLEVRPLLSGRDPHALQRENPAFRFTTEAADASATALRVRPYAGIPSIRMQHDGTFLPEPLWYRNFLYRVERDRGLDHLEDLASPGRFTFDLARGPAHLLLLQEGPQLDDYVRRHGAASLDPDALRRREQTRRARFASPLQRAADAYLVRRGGGLTVIAGYPWFGDWGRDTFIALRGLCIAGDRLADAGRILGEWAGAVSAGMLPNRFPDRGETPEYNSVDAALWYAIAVHEYLQACRATGAPAPAAETARLRDAVLAIITGYAAGTRQGIHLADDGLLACGEAGVQLTWMDARVGERVITPRQGKPVEIQALWLNVLDLARDLDERIVPWLSLGLASFRRRFVDHARGCLYDVVDVDGVPDSIDVALRPNQIFAVGGLPRPLVDRRLARQIVDRVERSLWTPLGLRTLAPDDPRYRPHYRGGVAERDGAYHQGTAWPYLLGPFVEAWLRVRDFDEAAIATARARFLQPLLAHLAEYGLGHVSEVTDGDPPHRPGGCPFQAWSMGELLRMQTLLDTPPALPPSPIDADR